MKKAKLFLAAALLTISMNHTAFAGVWQPQENGQWKYQNDDGSYLINCWQWIDGNSDGISECYYFDDAGNCLMNTITPDGNMVDASGALVVGGMVQTQTTAANTGVPTVNSQETNNITNSVWISATGEKYHSIPNCGKMDPNKAQQLSLSDAVAMGYTSCSKCH